MKILRMIAFSILLFNIVSVSAFAAQVAGPTVSGESYFRYESTPKNFTADGLANYPYEIYLPNEEDPASYRIHSNYTKNTDACASCHATHTAVGPSLLQWETMYETCMACHDGTVTTTYNVLLGQIANNFNEETGYPMPTYGGNFATLEDVDPVDYKNGSAHMVKPGAMYIKGAPGGSSVGESIDLGNGKIITAWDQEFSCDDCHSPHGQGGNARILHPDPNGMATKQAEKINHLYNVETVNGVAYVMNSGQKATLIKGFPYKLAVQSDTSGSVTDITYKFDIDNSGDYITGSYTLLKPKAEYPGALGEIKNVYGTAAITVKMAIYDYLKKDEKVLHLSGINTFCGTCHVDYNTEDEVLDGNGPDTIMGDEDKRPGYGNPNGEYSSAHRHAVGVSWNYGGDADENYIGPDKIMKTMGTDESNQRISCLTCHFAHGTDTFMWEIWIRKFNDNQVMYPKLFGLFNDWVEIDENSFEPKYLKEIAGDGSVLKRLPNMATCEACHQKGKASEGYAANSGQAIQEPIPGDY